MKLIEIDLFKRNVSNLSTACELIEHFHSIKQNSQDLYSYEKEVSEAELEDYFQLKLDFLKEVDEVNQVKKRFANNLHLKNVSGMLLKADGISYYMHKPSYYTFPEPYEIPGLKTDLMKVEIPNRTYRSRQFNSDSQSSKQKDFTPKKLRKYPD